MINLFQFCVYILTLKLIARKELVIHEDKEDTIDPNLVTVQTMCEKTTQPRDSMYGDIECRGKVVGDSLVDQMVDCQVIVFKLAGSLCWVIFSGEESSLLEDWTWSTISFWTWWQCLTTAI